MIDKKMVEAYASELFTALNERRPIPSLEGRGCVLSIDDAYNISLEFLAKREALGERVIGKKIGLTSKVVQDMFGVRQPDFGFLTDKMLVANKAKFEIGSYLLQPRAEAEIAFILKKDLQGPNVSAADVLAATESVSCCFEIVDSRIEDWRIGIGDTIADNASSGIFVLGDKRVHPKDLDFEDITCKVTKNDAVISQGSGSAVMGSPVFAVAWLANTLGQRGVSLNAGEIILSGSLVSLEPVAQGDIFELHFEELGSVCISFI